MIITRKIQIFVCESDNALRKTYYDRLYAIRDIAVKAANIATSTLFAIDNKIQCLDEESRKLITYVGAKDTPSSRQNAAYSVMSHQFKNSELKVADMLACLAQYVTKTYQEDRKKGMWKRSLRSYKNDIPMPYSKKAFVNLRFSDYVNGEGNTMNGCFFTLAGIPFQMKFGRDRSGNRLIVERVISGEYKMCTSSIKIDDNKVFLLLCVDIPKKEVNLKEKKVMYAFLGQLNPIVCTCDIQAYKEYDNGARIFEIGSKDEFFYRRRQIQEAVRRCQMNSKYSTGGKGRKRKCQSIERWHDKENDYVDTKLHTYSRRLVDLAVKHECGQIHLLEQIHREENAKDEEPLILRNWSYYGLKEKIEYKCKMYGIKLTVGE